MNSHLCSLDVI